jgi:putative ABC transport system permease protein
MNFLSDLRFALRSLTRAKGFALTVIATLALGIGANAAIFSVVRGVLLRPLPNHEEDRLIYIRQTALGLGAENTSFSVPEAQDLRAGAKTLNGLAEFSVIGFTVVGLGEPRNVRAGVVNGAYFTVMGLRPVLGRLIGPQDDGPAAAGVAVLTHRFWATDLKGDPSVIGKDIRLGARVATVIGVVEPSLPYPTETQIIANVATSWHHLSAAMTTDRSHRMTELFARLAPGADLEAAKAELAVLHRATMTANPHAYPANGQFDIVAVRLRDQLTESARTVLLALQATSLIVFIIACLNVANLILARSLRREGELSVRAALGASNWALRRTLLAESLLLCGVGVVFGLILARPMVEVFARYAARYSIRALDVTVDASMLAFGVLLAAIAAVLLAYVPRLPSSAPSTRQNAGRNVQITSGSTQRLRLFAITQIAASFVLLVGAVTLLGVLMDLQRAPTGVDTRRVLALDVPVTPGGRTPEAVMQFYNEALRRIGALPGVERVAVGTSVPWRDAGIYGPGLQFTVEGYASASAEEDPRAMFRTVSPGFFAALGVPIIAGRDFTDADRRGSEKVVIVSESLAKKMFSSGVALDRHLRWTDRVLPMIQVSGEPRRIVGIVADLDDENVKPGPALNVYHPLEQEQGGGRFFVRTPGDPYRLVAPVRRIIHELHANQPVERPATLQDVRDEILAPDRLNAVVFGVFAGVALTIAVIGVAGVLAFSVSARTREFGVRLAVGSAPGLLLSRVLKEGAVIALTGITAGIFVGLLLVRTATAFAEQIKTPGVLPVLSAALVLTVAAVLASLIPAARAARVDVVTALRSE